MYHGVGLAAPHGEPRYTVTAEALRAQLERLAALDVRVLPLTRALAGERGAVLTFDDGEETVARVAAPLLERLGLRATCYLTSAWVGTTGYLAKAQVRELAAAGWVLGSHGRTHCYLSAQDDTVLEDELRGSRADLEDLVGAAVVHLSLPGGRGDGRVRRAACVAGYTSIATSLPGLNRRLDPLALERLAVRSDDTALRVARLATGYPPTLFVEMLAAAALDLGKKVLGNKRYEQARRAALRLVGTHRD
jgi:peptidoglycan/xylan/chitin deacetylase (PgdA/CDA1 family)